MPVLVLDNGASHIKAAFHAEGNLNSEPFPAGAGFRQLCVPNCIGTVRSALVEAGDGGGGGSANTVVVGLGLESLTKYHGLILRRPQDRGFVVDEALQSRLWQHVLSVFGVADEQNVDLILTTPFGTPPAVASLLRKLCFSRFRFRSATLVSPSFLALHSGAAENRSEPLTGIVVDAGFSSTFVVPYDKGQPITAAIQRIDVGGKLLTNRLKELLSFSQLNLLEDTWLVNVVKERTVRVATNFRHEMTLAAPVDAHISLFVGSEMTEEDTKDVGDFLARSRELPPEIQPHFFVLPTLPESCPLGIHVAVNGAEWKITNGGNDAKCVRGTRKTPHGGLDDRLADWHRKGAQILTLWKERLAVPELLFSPSDIGVPQRGVAEAIAKVGTGAANEALVSDEVQKRLLSHVLLCGGCTAIDGYAERVEKDVRSAVADTIQPAVIHAVELPQFCALRGAIGIFEGSSDASKTARKLLRQRALTRPTSAAKDTEGELFSDAVASLL